MSKYKVSLKWKADSEDFSYKKYNRTHQWTFGGGSSVKASAAPEYLGNAEYANPEEAFAASLASCHLLTFLAIASYKKYQLNTYEDEVTAIVEKNKNNKLAVTKVILRPRVAFTGEKAPDETELKKMHEKAHAECFISNSVLTEVVVEPQDQERVSGNNADQTDSFGPVAGSRSQNVESAEEMKERERSDD
ncbi:MAG: OsmC family protein [Anditalea sp.]